MTEGPEARDPAPARERRRGFRRRDRELDALTGLGAVLGILESAFLPAGFPIRLGLGNAVVVIAVRRHGTRGAVRVGLIRNVLVGFARMTIFTPTILFGLTAGVASALAMGLVHALAGGHLRDETVGALGAVAANLVQVWLYVSLSDATHLFPVIGAVGVLWGMVVGGAVGHAAGRIDAAWREIAAEAWEK